MLPGEAQAKARVKEILEKGAEGTDVSGVIPVAELVQAVYEEMLPVALVLPEYRVEDEPEAFYRISDNPERPDRVRLCALNGRVGLELVDLGGIAISSPTGLLRPFFLAGLSACEVADRNGREQEGSDGDTTAGSADDGNVEG